MKRSLYKNYIKRCIDILFSALMLFLLWPLLIIIAVIVKLDSKGPAVFVQDRLTLNGRVFKMLKFRTMIVNAEQQGTGAYSFGNDPRITKAGNILRKLSLDELLQLVNIFKGDMSFVGPRPILTYHPCKYEEYTEEDDAVYIGEQPDGGERNKRGHRKRTFQESGGTKEGNETAGDTGRNTLGETAEGL